MFSLTKPTNCTMTEEEREEIVEWMDIDIGLPIINGTMAPHGVEWRAPLSFSQSTLHGRQTQSHACTLIVCQLAAEWHARKLGACVTPFVMGAGLHDGMEENLEMDGRFVHVISESVRLGNDLHARAMLTRDTAHMNFTVPDAMHAVGDCVAELDFTEVKAPFSDDFELYLIQAMSVWHSTVTRHLRWRRGLRAKSCNRDSTDSLPAPSSRTLTSTALKHQLHRWATNAGKTLRPYRYTRARPSIRNKVIVVDDMELMPHLHRPLYSATDPYRRASLPPPQSVFDEMSSLRDGVYHRSPALTNADDLRLTAGGAAEAAIEEIGNLLDLRGTKSAPSCPTREEEDDHWPILREHSTDYNMYMLVIAYERSCLVIYDPTTALLSCVDTHTHGRSNGALVATARVVDITLFCLWMTRNIYAESWPSMRAQQSKTGGSRHQHTFEVSIVEPVAPSLRIEQSAARRRRLFNCTSSPVLKNYFFPKHALQRPSSRLDDLIAAAQTS